jgi:hypothetical protein
LLIAAKGDKKGETKKNRAVSNEAYAIKGLKR